MTTKEYKGFQGRYEYQSENDVYYGKIINIDDLVTFEATSVVEIQKTFEESVDEYLKLCNDLGR